MIAVKVIGICLILASACAFAYVTIRDSKERVSVCGALIDFVSYVDARIFYFRDPLDAIFDSYENDALEQSGFVNALSERNVSRAIEVSRTGALLSPEIRKVMSDFSDRLGKTPVDDQHNNCRYCIDALNVEYDKLRTEVPKKAKSRSSIAVIGALALILLII